MLMQKTLVICHQAKPQAVTFGRLPITCDPLGRRNRGLHRRCRRLLFLRRPARWRSSSIGTRLQRFEEFRWLTEPPPLVQSWSPLVLVALAVSAGVRAVAALAGRCCSWRASA